MKKKKKLSGLSLSKNTISKFQNNTIKGGVFPTFATGCNSQDCHYSGPTCDLSECACE